jgi:hypothetical protein
MIRKFEQTDPSVHRFAAMVITNEKKALFLHRDFEGETVEQDGPINVTLPCFIRLKARKDLVRPELIEFFGEFSLDGTNWTQVNAATKFKSMVVWISASPSRHRLVRSPIRHCLRRKRSFRRWLSLLASPT